MEKNKVFSDCQKIYETLGFSAVIDHVNVQKKEKSNPDYDNVRYEHCTACDCDVPSLDNICLICGQSTFNDANWSEIHNDFEDNGFIHIDAWSSDDDMEPGKVIAKINVQTKEVLYIDKRAITNSLAQEAIKEVIERIEARL